MESPARARHAGRSRRKRDAPQGPELKFLPGRHRVPTVGFLFSEVRKKLTDELIGRPGEEIAALRAGGAEVTRREEIPLLGYPGDCGAEVFDAAPELFRARVLLIECSFLAPEDRDRAREHAHIHLDDIIERASLFENEAIVLTHFSLRYQPEEILEALGARPQRRPIRAAESDRRAKRRRRSRDRLLRR